MLEAKLTDGNCDIMIAANSGKAIRFPESKVRAMGRGASGVRGISIDTSKNFVVGMICVNNFDSMFWLFLKMDMVKDLILIHTGLPTGEERC